MFDSCICVEPYEYPKVHDAKIRTARTSHRCEECCGEITRGDRYEYYSALWDGKWEHTKTCLTCVRIRESLFSCGCISGEMWTEIHDAYCEDGDCICPESWYSG